ncbi:hypothetical protein [Rhizobium yanglingense]
MIYAALTTLIVAHHARENGLPLMPRSRGLRLVAASALTLLVAGSGEIRLHGLSSLEALSHGQGIVSFTEAKFAVAGAGLGGGKTRIVKFRFKWNGFRQQAAAGSQRVEPSA